MFIFVILTYLFLAALSSPAGKELTPLLSFKLCFIVLKSLSHTVPRGCLQFVIVVFPDHTHLLFFSTAFDCIDS